MRHGLGSAVVCWNLNTVRHFQTAAETPAVEVATETPKALSQSDPSTKSRYNVLQAPRILCTLRPLLSCSLALPGAAQGPPQPARTGSQQQHMRLQQHEPAQWGSHSTCGMGAFVTNSLSSCPRDANISVLNLLNSLQLKVTPAQMVHCSALKAVP